jgi:hypothetical protein
MGVFELLIIVGFIFGMTVAITIALAAGKNVNGLKRAVLYRLMDKE